MVSHISGRTENNVENQFIRNNYENRKAKLRNPNGMHAKV